MIFFVIKCGEIICVLRRFRALFADGGRGDFVELGIRLPPPPRVLSLSKDHLSERHVHSPLTPAVAAD